MLNKIIGASVRGTEGKATACHQTSIHEGTNLLAQVPEKVEGDERGTGVLNFVAPHPCETPGRSP